MKWNTVVCSFSNILPYHQRLPLIFSELASLSIFPFSKEPQIHPSPILTKSYFAFVLWSPGTSQGRGPWDLNFYHSHVLRNFCLMKDNLLPKRKVVLVSTTIIRCCISCIYIHYISNLGTFYIGEFQFGFCKQKSSTVITALSFHKQSCLCYHSEKAELVSLYPFRTSIMDKAQKNMPLTPQ